MIKKRFLTIKCPNCRYEYLPGEIFMPNNFLGQPRYVHRDERGNILEFMGIEQNAQESFVCENCDKLFNIECEFNFKVSYNEDEDFSKLYETPREIGKKKK